MKKNYFKNLMQVSLLLGAAFVISSCDDVIGQEDNPVASYVQWKAKTPEAVTLKIGNTYTVQATAVSSAIIVYESENPEIAKVDPVTGEITAVAVGETNINAVITGASSAGKSVFTPEKISIKVIVKDGKVSLKAKAAEKVQTINTVDAAKTIDVSKFFDVYPETGNTITYTLKHHINNTGKKITGYADAGASLGSITTAGVYTQGTNTKDTTVYVVAEITGKADGFDWALDAKKNHINHVDTIAINIKESIAYMNAKGERTILTADKYKELDLTKTSAVEAGTYYVTKGVYDSNKTIDIKGDVTLIFMNGWGSSLQNLDDKTDNAKLNIFGEAIPGAEAGTYEAWNPNININAGYNVANCITNFKEINIYAGTFTTYGGIIVKDVNVYAGKLYANSFWNCNYAMKLSGKLTVNGGLVLAQGQGSDTETSFAVIGDVVLNNGSFHAYNGDYRAVKGSLTAATGFEFLQGDTSDPTKATAIEGTTSNSKYIWGQAVPKK